MFPLAGAISMASNQDIEERLREALAKRYWIESKIGSGGMATIYLAQDLKQNRQVAVKVLDPDLAQSLGAERFLREIEAAANLRHRDPDLMLFRGHPPFDEFMRPKG